VAAYDTIDALPRRQIAFIDVAGDERVRRRVHEHFRDDLIFSGLVGATHLDASAFAAPPALDHGRSPNPSRRTRCFASAFAPLGRTTSTPTSRARSLCHLVRQLADGPPSGRSRSGPLRVPRCPRPPRGPERGTRPEYALCGLNRTQAAAGINAGTQTRAAAGAFSSLVSSLTRRRMPFALDPPAGHPRGIARARRSALAGATVALLAVAAATGGLARAGPVIGMGDASASMFSDGNFLALGIRAARIVVPYDAVIQGGWERAQVDSWMAAAADHGIEPSVAFEHSRHADAAPSVAAYGAAIQAFRDRYPQVRIVAPWNEANHPTQPTWNNPALAADYYAEARRVFPDARIVAGNVVDIDNIFEWLRVYREHLPEEPQLWGIINYGDTTQLTDPLNSTTGAVLSAVPGELWITETGGIVRFWPFYPFDLDRAAKSTEHAFVMANMSPRITRMYLYNWYAPSDPWATWDTGLVNADGTPRPALDVVRRELMLAAAARPRLARDGGGTLLSKGRAPGLRMSVRRRSTRVFRVILTRVPAAHGTMALRVSGPRVRAATHTTAAARKRLRVRIPRGRHKLRLTATFDGTRGWADSRLAPRTLRVRARAASRAG
jgi:hypothetical protein